MQAAGFEALVAEVVGLHDAPREVPPFSSRYPDLTMDDAYAVAARLHGLRMQRGWKPVGRKIGFTNRTLWARYGVQEPMWGTVYDRTLIRAEAAQATVALAGLVQPRIEPEVCFGLRETPRSSAPEALLEAIAWVSHSVEIVQCHHPGWKVTIPDCATDNGLHGRLVAGPQLPLADVPRLAEELPRLRASLLHAGSVVDQGVGANVLGSPLLSLAYLVDLLARQPASPPLGAGEVVTTGVLTDAHPVTPGQTWTTSLEGLPLVGLTVHFT